MTGAGQWIWPAPVRSLRYWLPPRGLALRPVLLPELRLLELRPDVEGMPRMGLTPPLDMELLPPRGLALRVPPLLPPDDAEPRLPPLLPTQERPLPLEPVLPMDRGPL